MKNGRKWQRLGENLGKTNKTECKNMQRNK